LEWFGFIGGLLTVAGKFISIEGGEGAGKSTQIAALADAIRTHGFDVIVTREPGGTEGAEAIRQLLLGGSADRWQPAAEALLFAAARSDHVERLIRPALAKGQWAISDRFLDSSRAYQGASSGIGDADIMTLHGIGSGGFLPQRTLVLDIDPAAAALRTQKRDGLATDRIGGRDAHFHAAVRAAFLSLAAQEPHRIRVIDASGDPATVTALMLAQIADLLPET
jgi:dTMP kinase